MDYKIIREELEKHGLLNSFYESILDQFETRGLSPKQKPFLKRIEKTYQNLKKLEKFERVKFYNEKDYQKSKENYDFLKKAVENKTVAIGCHYDADGVSSGALLFNLVKKMSPKEILITSSDENFFISKNQFEKEADLYIITDINPGKDIEPEKLIYIDHHPLETYSEEKSKRILKNYTDESVQSASLLIFKTFLLHKINDIKRYELETFFTLTGYIGDMGNPLEDLDSKLFEAFSESFPEFFKLREFNGNISINLERFRSMFNLGKRFGWDGNLILDDLINLRSYNEINHFFSDEDKYKIIKEELKLLYSQDHKTFEKGKIAYALLDIDDYYNITGVISSKLANKTEKPSIAIQKRKNIFKGSMRSNGNFNCNKFVQNCDLISGAGHEQAAGFEVEKEKLDKFLEYLDNYQ